MTNILEHTGRVVAWNEPRVLDNIFRQANHAWNRKTSKLVLQAAIKMLTKPFSGYDNEPLAFVITLCAAYGSQWRMFHDVAPKATKLFLYRDLNAAAESQRCVIVMVPTPTATLHAAAVKATPTRSHSCGHSFPVLLEDFRTCLRGTTMSWSGATGLC